MALGRLLAAGALLWAAGAGAADIGVMPVGLSLAQGRDRAAITVTNQGKDGVVMQVDTVAWTQEGGEDRYVPTAELLVNPPLFTVKPGHSQVLRVGLRQPPSGEREAAYRLILREVPQAAAVPASPVAGGRVQVLLQMRLPVYVDPARPDPGQRWQARWGRDGTLETTLSNTGNVHLVVGELRLRAADAAPDAAPIAMLKAGTPVFPGQSRTWQLPVGPAARGQRCTLEVTTDRGPQHVALDPVHP
ncbi:molecular chaperone [Parasulfuritortus cantonensis]|uniref:Molecular chaperone n=1 Tax=Parasulfuritortus cantonensis TaxID=2528202 RepID=A0A4R1B643_9PROT|nr:fimbria/pilus periplasmic chaperone [Parasulfuritortus cantonensis]TCJ11698.1 molecular chaperone [Parasulfuritortus cantonensis]